MDTNSEIFHAYCAGAIDSDGWISIYRSHRTVGKRYAHKPTYFCAKLGFTNTSRIVPDLLKAAFGGSFYRYDRSPNKDMFVWEVDGKKAIIFITAILPYLQMKRRQAELALQLIRIIQEQYAEIKRTQKPPYHITEEMNEKRKAIWEECSKLNNPRSGGQFRMVTPLP